MDFKRYLGKIQNKNNDGESNQKSESIEEVKILNVLQRKL